jgi:hypothetical protein
MPELRNEPAATAERSRAANQICQCDLSFYRVTCIRAKNEEGWMFHDFIKVAAVALAIASSEPASAQRIKAGLLTCDVSAGIGFIIGSKKEVSCSFTPEGPGRREDYDGSISKFGLDLGVTGAGLMVWAVFTDTVAGPGFLAGDYVGASGEVSVAAGLGANVLIGGSNRTVALQPISLSGQIGLNLAIGVASLRLGLPRR